MVFFKIFWIRIYWSINYEFEFLNKYLGVFDILKWKFSSGGFDKLDNLFWSFYDGRLIRIEVLELEILKVEVEWDIGIGNVLVLLLEWVWCIILINYKFRV